MTFQRCATTQKSSALAHHGCTKYQVSRVGTYKLSSFSPYLHSSPSINRLYFPKRTAVLSMSCRVAHFKNLQPGPHVLFLPSISSINKIPTPLFHAKPGPWSELKTALFYIYQPSQFSKIRFSRHICAVESPLQNNMDLPPHVSLPPAAFVQQNPPPAYHVVA
jgi:hypothetical protein